MLMLRAIPRRVGTLPGKQLSQCNRFLADRRPADPLQNHAGNSGNIGKLHHDTLDANVSKVQVYAKWADTYDADVAGEDYRGPQEVASQVFSALNSKLPKGGPLMVLDAGCGTGLVGEKLMSMAGDLPIRCVGCDISIDMVNKARGRGYSSCFTMDLNCPLTMADDSFDAATCAGTFVQTHVSPDPLLFELCRVVKPGGVVAATVRRSLYDDDPSYAWVVQRLEAVGHTVHMDEFQYLNGVTAMLVRIEVAGAPPKLPYTFGLELPRETAVRELAKSVRRRRERFPQSSLLAPRPTRPGGLKVLNACCGMGETGVAIAAGLASDLGLPADLLDLHGFDLSPLSRTDAPGCFQDVRTADARETLWMYPDNEFDGVVCIGALAPGSGAQPFPLVEELVRVTQPGGAVVLSADRSLGGEHNKDNAALEEVLGHVKGAGHTVTQVALQTSPTGLVTEMVTIEKCPSPRPKRNEEGRTVAYLGVGRMGQPMVKALLAAGYNVQLWDKYPANVEQLEGFGGKWMPTPREAAEGADLVVTNLPLPEHVREALEGQDGALAGMRPGSVWADFSTTDYHNTLYLDKQARARGVRSLECPVTNLHQLGVEVGNAAFFVGGDVGAFEEVVPELNTMGVVSSHVGAIGQAQTVKLLTNITYYAQIVYGTEALIAAQRAGIPPLFAWQRLDASSGVSAAFRHFLLCVIDGSYDKSCSLEVVHKDMNLTKALDVEFTEKGSPHAAWRVLPGTLDVFNEARERYPDRTPGERNHLYVARILEERNNTSLQLDGFTSPSHHGAGDYKIAAFHRDPVGRVQPFVPSEYRVDNSFVPTPEQEALLQDLAEWLTFTNYAGYLDAEALGLGFGLKPEQIHHLITWSVGTSWVSDNLATYTPPDLKLMASKVKGFSEGLELPGTTSLLDAYMSQGSVAAIGDFPAWNKPQVNVKTMLAPEPLRLRTISASRLERGDPRELARLRSSFEEHGIFWLDTPAHELGSEALRQSCSFFDLPVSVKQQFRSEVQTVFPSTCRGFAAVGVETLNPEEGPDYKEHFDLGIAGQDASDLPFNGPTVLPTEAEAPGFVRAAHTAQGMVMDDLVPLLVRSTDAAYGAGADSSLARCMEQPTLIQRFLNYPSGHRAFAGRHTDNGLFTVLFVDNLDSLHAMDPKSGAWRAIAGLQVQRPLVFAGDILEKWSGGRVLSLPHRVQHSQQQQARRSLAFFVYPHILSTLQPLAGGQAVRTKEHMLQNFDSIWVSGNGGGLGQSRFEIPQRD